MSPMPSNVKMTGPPTQAAKPPPAAMGPRRLTCYVPSPLRFARELWPAAARAASLRSRSAARHERHRTAWVLMFPFATSYYHFWRSAGHTSSVPQSRHTTRRST
jgi:hypothetical protein